jgi:hypothetical protein
VTGPATEATPAAKSAALLPPPPTGSGTPNGCIASVTFISASARHGAARSMSIPRRSSFVV